MNAADIMTTDVVSVRPDDRISEAIRLMSERHISGIPVTAGNGQLIGILTEGDLLRRAEVGTEPARPRWLEFLMSPGRLAVEYVHTHARKIEELMTSDVMTVSPETPLRDVVELMRRRHIKRVPVVREGVCIGIVSRADVVRALGRILSSDDQPALDDAEIRDRIERELAGRPWGAAKGIRVAVAAGVVTLDGVIVDERQRKAALVTAENAPGVKAVRDHLTWIEPSTGIAFSPEEQDPGEAPSAE